MSREITLKEAFLICRNALEDVKDAPLSREEMILLAETALGRVKYYMPLYRLSAEIHTDKNGEQK